MAHMHILAIETSCDETSAAVVADGRTILSNIISSQITLHSRYGGVVPEVASRQHVVTILPVIQNALLQAAMELKDMQAIAVTYGPGLAGSLIIGVNAAKAIACSLGLPLLGINHLEAHIYANWLGKPAPEFPCLCLIVSGGHTDLIFMRGHGHFTRLGQTRDDAAGEAFDKGARILELGYPGGPIIEAEAKKGRPSYKLPRAWLRGNDDFSFSGLKTALLHLAQANAPLTSANRQDIACSFQNAIVEVLTVKTIKAAQRLGVGQILLAGGVAANRTLADSFLNSTKIPVSIPPPVLCTDNAAMTAACAYFHFLEGNKSELNLDVEPGLSMPG
jgi:N6-L-threonylcarbamoyladenine synthase